MSKISDLVGNSEWNNSQFADLNKRVIATRKKFEKVANALSDKLKISSTSAKEILESDEALDVFKDSYGYRKDKIMKNVDHPSHYQSNLGIEVIDVIEAFNLNFNLGNVIKYVLRCGKKDVDVQELEKAKWYLEHEISNRKNK